MYSLVCLKLVNVFVISCNGSAETVNNRSVRRTDSSTQYTGTMATVVDKFGTAKLTVPNVTTQPSQSNVPAS